PPHRENKPGFPGVRVPGGGMTQDRVREAVTALSEDLPVRVLVAALAENVAELAAVVARLGAKDLPPEFTGRLRAIEEDLRALARLCQAPPIKRDRKPRVQEMPLL
ncbi:MAG: hypothetical protein ABDI20_05645, partial [Candidatus Bipolaricaulaceae bacterium]